MSEFVRFSEIPIQGLEPAAQGGGRGPGRPPPQARRGRAITDGVWYDTALPTKWLSTMIEIM
jgi:hypothetical protein